MRLPCHPGRANVQSPTGLLAIRTLLRPLEPNGTFNSGIVRETVSGDFLEIARTDQPAPGAGGVTLFRGFNPPVVSPSDRTAFHGFLKEPGEDRDAPFYDSGVFREDAAGSLRMIARVGDVVSHENDTYRFRGFADVSIGTANRVSFLASFEEDSGRPGFFAGLFRENMIGEPELIVRTGDLLPIGDTQTLGMVNSFRHGAVTFNEGGRAAFSATLTDPSGTQSLGQAIVKENSNGNLEAIAATGQPVPGLEGDIVFDEFLNGVVINSNGQTAFQAILAGEGIDSTNHVAIFAETLGGDITLIARLGDELDVDDDPLVNDLRTINRLSFLTSGISGAGRLTPFNVNGEYAFAASFTDRSSGVFVSTAAKVPEPSAAVLAVLAAFVVTGIRGGIGQATAYVDL